MKKKITFFELLTLLSKGKMPDVVNYWGDTYYKEYYKDSYNYYNHNGAPLMEVIGLNETVGSLLYEKNISYDEPILTDKEREYLSTVLKPFKNYSFYIRKRTVPPSVRSSKYGFIQVMFMPESGVLNFPDLKEPMYMGMELDKEYSAIDLGLWKEEDKGDL